MKSFGGRYGAELAALAVVTVWATNFVFTKAALTEFDALAFTFLRYVAMLVLAWAIVWVRGSLLHKMTPLPTRRDLPRLALVGVLGFSLYMVAWIIGLSYTTAFSGALLLGTTPLWAALLLWAFRMERIVVGQWAALLLALCGVAVFFADKLGTGFQIGSIGDVVSLASAFFFAAYTVAGKPLHNRYPAPVLIAYTLTIGALPVLVVALPSLLAQDWSRLTVVGWAALAWAAVVPVYISWTIWAWANKEIGVARTSTFMYLVPIIGGASSWLLLGEEFGIFKIGGAVLTFASLLLMRYATRRRKVTATAAPRPALR